MLAKLILPIILLASAFVNAHAENYINIGSDGFLDEDRQFITYMIGGSVWDETYKSPEIIKKRSAEILYTPIVNKDNKTIGVEPQERGYKFSDELIDFFSNKDNLEKLFTDKGLYNVEEILVTEETNLLNQGFMVCGRIGNDYYFIPIIGKGRWQKEDIQRQTYGRFEHLKLYTHSEILKLVAPQECTFILNGENLQCDPPVTMQNGIIKVPLRSLLEALGSEVYWYEDTKNIEFTVPGTNTSYTLVYDEFFKGYSNMYCNNNENNMTFANVTLNNDRAIIMMDFFYSISKIFNLTQVEYDMDKHIVAYDVINY